MILNEIQSDMLIASGREYLSAVTDNNFDSFIGWLDNLIPSGKPRIPANLKVDYTMLVTLNRNIQEYLPTRQSGLKFHNAKYQTFLIASANNTLRRMGEAKLTELITSLHAKNKPTTNKLVIGNFTFKNDSPMSSSRFEENSRELAKFLDSFTGFHAQALGGNLEIHFKATPQLKAKAAYKSNLDQIWVRESASRETSTQYASLKYIISHELGHRYERKVGKPKWFRDNEWDTTPYSKTSESWDGEQFAEIFALSFWGAAKYPQFADKIQKFVDRMK